MNYDEASVIIEHRADPHIYKHGDGFYYFTATVPEYDKIILRRSKTISGLSKAKEVDIWLKHDKGEMSSYIWAPEIHFIDDAWYIYFAARDTVSLNHFDGNAHKIYVIECTDTNPLTNNWKELGQVKTNWESFSLDATTFENNGQRYLLWAQKDSQIDGNSNIYIAKMKSPSEIEGKQVMLTKPELPWETIGYKVNEGPYILKQNSSIILSYSGSATDANYAMGVLIANEDDDLMLKESWIKHNNPIRKSDSEISEFGPGHNCFTYAEDNKTPIMVYHARDYEEIIGDPLHDINRHTKVVKFNMDY
ncbi:MAG: family 43 glycosylhydrolase [Spirochaetaceae bacterium]